jgi:hypothetical protein
MLYLVVHHKLLLMRPLDSFNKQIRSALILPSLLVATGAYFIFVPSILSSRTNVVAVKVQRL